MSKTDVEKEKSLQDKRRLSGSVSYLNQDSFKELMEDRFVSVYSYFDGAN